LHTYHLFLFFYCNFEPLSRYEKQKANDLGPKINCLMAASAAKIEVGKLSRADGIAAF